MRMSDLRHGWRVLSNEGENVATVQEVGQNYVRASRLGFGHDLYIPSSAIANVERETVHLNMTKRDAEQMGWEQRPRSGDEPDTGESDLDRHI
jgi:hypothetical protein